MFPPPCRLQIPELSSNQSGPIESATPQHEDGLLGDLGIFTVKILPAVLLGHFHHGLDVQQGGIGRNLAA